jgi:hypothetical protein
MSARKLDARAILRGGVVMGMLRACVNITGPRGIVKE